MKNTIKIFYSWQSDLAEKTNKRAIRDMLIKAKSQIEQEHKINILIDEATNEEIGSPNIPLTIVRKIVEADIFIADISIVNNDYHGRRMPNPNVMFELGFAVGKLGWGRVILMFNKFEAKVENLPFDIDRHRVFQYGISQKDDNDKIKSIIGSFVPQLYEQINNILIKNPQKECHKIERTEDDIKRQRDIKNIKTFLNAIQIETIDQFIYELPGVIINDIFFFYDRLDWIAKSSTFHMYDKELYSLFVEFYFALQRSISHYQQYNYNQDQTRLIWHNPLDMPLGKDEQETWDSIEEDRKTMRASLNKILDILRNNYLEIDVDEISKNNFQELIAYNKK